MIVVRNVFNLKFGKAKEAKALLKDGFAIAKRLGMGPDRVLGDVTGTFYTVVLENAFPTLGAFEESMAKGFGNQEWEAWYQKFVPLVDSGHREIFTVVQE